MREFNHLLKKSRSVHILAAEFGFVDLGWQSDEHKLLNIPDALRVNNSAHKIFVEDLYDKY